MYGMFRSLRRRVNKRRFVAFWICLVAIELLCPVLCTPQGPSALASGASPADSIVSAKVNSGSLEASMSACNHEGENDESANCVDECLCHAVAIPVIAINNKSVELPSDQVVGEYKPATSNSLPTPYLPPKVS